MRASAWLLASFLKETWNNTLVDGERIQVEHEM